MTGDAEYGSAIKRLGALFGSLLVTYGMFAAASEMAVLLDRSPEFGPAAIGFLATLMLVFEWIVAYFDISPPPEFQEVDDDA